MFSYNKNIREKKMFISLPAEIKYNFSFLNSITELMENVEKSQCENIFFSCAESKANIDKMGAAYLYNTLLNLARTKRILIDQTLRQMFHKKVAHSDGAKFTKIDIAQDSSSQIQQCYCISDDKYVNHFVQILVEFISGNNLILKNAKEFLITTIGEIFSNAFGHSTEKRVLFMYDIEWQNSKFYLVINITDYGKTIIHNVQEYQKEKFGETLNGCDCIRWAIKPGNTTRIGSGGYGLPTLTDYVSNIKGELLIFSGNSIYALKGVKENILNAKGEFYGTSISMKIPLFDTSKAIMLDEESNKIISINLDKI